MTQPISILLADDHTLVRDMLKRRLEDEPDMIVVSSVGNGQTALQQCLERKPDIALLDIEMPGINIFEAAHDIKAACPETRILFLSAFYQDHYIEQALKLEASGYLTKTELTESVIKAIRAVMQGRLYFSREVQSRLVIESNEVHLAQRQETRANLLTNREKQVLTYLAQGLSKKEIARLMNISVKTVDQHSIHIMEKLDIHDRVQLARFAIREGLVKA